MDVAIVVPVFFMLCVAACIVAPGYFRSREQAQLQETLRAALNRGADLPPEFIEALQKSQVIRVPVPSRHTDLRRGIVLLSVGVGLALLGFGLWAGIEPYSDDGGYITGIMVACSGAIPGMIGIAYLILWALKPKGSESGSTAHTPGVG